MKRETKANQQQGNRISGKKASAERYIPFYEFLLFDPLYKEMSDRAKTLYTFLRSKVKDFEHKQEQYESGEGTKSYADDEGNIFILADNTEIEYILNASEPTVIKVKNELTDFGLLEQTKVKDKANRLYILEPSILSEHWAWINDVKKLRSEKAAKNEEKAKKRRRNKEEKAPESGNSKNLGYGNSKNLGYGNSKNISKSKSKYKSKLTLNTSKNTLNLSIIDSEEIQNFLSKHGDRLTDSKLQAIQELHEIYKHIGDMVFINKTVEALERSKSNFKGYLNKSLEKYIADQAAGKEAIREEVKPEWYGKEDEPQPEQSPEEKAELEKRKAELHDQWKAWKAGQKEE